MSCKPIALAGNRLLLSLRNLSCFTASDRIDLLARQPVIRKNSSSARDASMSGAHPPMTAIVVTKKNLPSFSEKRAAVQSVQSPPHAYDDDTLRTQASHRESGAVPSSTAVESALRSALGIGHSETTGATPPAPTAAPQPSPEFSANVSTQDPAILDWSLCDPGSEERAAETEPKPMKTGSTRILRLLHGDENEGVWTSEADRAEESSPADAAPRTTTEHDTGSKPVAVAETDSSEPSLSTAGKQDVGDECAGNAEASPSVASAPAKRRRRGARKRKKGSGKLNSASAPQRSVSDDGSSSDESCEVVGDEHVAGSEVAAGWISELPAGLISSADTEDDDDDPVYSLKPLFTGKYGSSSSTKKSKSSKDNRPNYFVAIQVDDINVHRTAKKVQDHMRSQAPNIEQALVGIPTLHITLLVLRVNDGDDSLQRAKDSLSRSHQAVKDDLEATPLVLQFQGLDHFKKEVLYVKAIGEESISRLKAIAQVCQEEFEKAKLDLSSNKAFAPHLTLAKLSKQSRRKNGIKKIEEEWYAAFKDEAFGMQKVNSLQLLSMLKPKDERGYYYCSLEHMFGDFSRDQVNGDHSECCAPVKSRASPRKIEQKLLKIDAAKEEVKRTISTLTNAKLQELSEAKQELSEAKPEPSEEESITEVSEEEMSMGENAERKE